MPNCQFGECSFCCRLIPIPKLGKPANRRCEHQKFKTGCAIYGQRPASCRIWSYRWLLNLGTGDLRRLDRPHYVIDSALDFVTVRQANWESAERCRFGSTLSIPMRIKKKALRACLARRAEEGIAAIVRYGPREGFVLFAPPFSPDGLWHERAGLNESQHSAAEILAAFACVAAQARTVGAASRQA